MWKGRGQGAQPLAGRPPAGPRGSTRAGHLATPGAAPQTCVWGPGPRATRCHPTAPPCRPALCLLSTPSRPEPPPWRAAVAPWTPSHAHGPSFSRSRQALHNRLRDVPSPLKTAIRLHPACQGLRGRPAPAHLPTCPPLPRLCPRPREPRPHRLLPASCTCCSPGTPPPTQPPPNAHPAAHANPARTEAPLPGPPLTCYGAAQDKPGLGRRQPPWGNRRAEEANAGRVFCVFLTRPPRSPSGQDGMS